MCAEPLLSLILLLASLSQRMPVTGKVVVWLMPTGSTYWSPDGIDMPVVSEFIRTRWPG